MASSCELPPLSLAGDPTENWKAWRQGFQILMKGKEGDPEELKCAQLLYLIGDDGRDIYKTFSFKKNSKQTIQSLLDKFENHFVPKKSKLMLERVKFVSNRQEKGQTAENFANELKKQAAKCDLGNLKDDMVKAMFIAGIKDPIIKQQMLENENMTLEAAVGLTRLTEMLNQMNAKKDEPTKQEKPQKQSQQINNCRFCGGNHERGKCFAFGKQCKACKGMNHTAKVCKNQNQNGAKKKEPTEGFVMI